MLILFENGLNTEANITKNIVEKVFDVKCVAKQGDFLDLLKFKKTLNGYELQKIKRFRNKILLTNKNIFTYDSTSKEDDWIFGNGSDSKQFIISVARLKTNSDNPSKILKISKNKYKKRIKFIVVHELGHQLIKNQKHYKKFILKNSETGHKTDLGWHCPDNKCIMSEVNSVKELDEHIKINYKSLFCKKCLSKGFNITP